MARPGQRTPKLSLGQQLTRALMHAARFAPLFASVVSLLLVGTGRLHELSKVSWADTLCVAFLLASIAGTVVRRTRRAARGSPRTVRDDVELGAQLIGAAYITVELFGSAVFPIVYLLMAFLVAFLERKPGAILLGVALLFDAAQVFFSSDERALVFVSHASFLILFAALYHAVLAAQVAASRHSEQAAVDRRIKEIEERARTYRLVASGTEDREGSEDREKWMLASVKEVEGAVGSAIEVAELALKTHSCAAFLLTSDDSALKLHDCRSQSDFVRREAFPAGEGVLGAVLKRRAPMRLHGRLNGITYYESAPDVKSVLAVPIVEGQGTGAVRGVLVADRMDATAFTDDDERMLVTVAGEVLRAIEVERVLNYIKRARDEKDRLYRAIDELNRTSKTQEVLSTALEVVRSSNRLDFAAFTLVEDAGGKRKHKVARVAGVASGRALEGVEFADNTGLVANVVRYGAPLPGRDVRQMERPVIFDEDTQLKGLASLKIVPLKAGERILGTLVAGSRKKAAFDDDFVRTLEVLAMQAAQSILRANLFEQMETMATTDGLTGLLNHRTFQSKCDESLLLSKRYEKKLSLMLTDIDHFKSVNDTYGHPVGDLVLKGVAKVLKRMARDTDIVARYGGEEFCVIMPETDAAGAKVIAERIRKEIEATTFDTEMGPLKVTMSLGIATFPEVSTEKQVLIDKADQCLYFAKHHGRNRSVTVAEMESGGKLKVAEG